MAKCSGASDDPVPLRTVRISGAIQHGKLPVTRPLHISVSVYAGWGRRESGGRIFTPASPAL